MYPASVGRSRMACACSDARSPVLDRHSSLPPSPRPFWLLMDECKVNWSRGLRRRKWTTRRGSRPRKRTSRVRLPPMQPPPQAKTAALFRSCLTGSIKSRRSQRKTSRKSHGVLFSHQHPPRLKS